MTSPATSPRMSGRERKMPPPPDKALKYALTRGSDNTITCDDIPTILGASTCHRGGITGEDIVVGVVDSGYYDHKFFGMKRTEWEETHHTTGWRYPTLAYPPVYKAGGEYWAPEDPETDKTGHGTGMAANFYSVAPRARLRIYPVQSFMESLEAAVEQCQVISLSKHSGAVAGYPTFEKRYRDAFEKARREGKVVVHAAGNGDSTPWPVENCPQEIIKVGGVHRKKDGGLEASDYARANTGDRQADICGLCGMMPAGAYIWLPADPDTNPDLQPLPGWNLASGTSSATPQVAGVVALMQQARVKNGMALLNMETAKSILRRTATPVSVGHPYDRVAADPAWCRLVNAEAAVRMAVE